MSCSHEWNYYTQHEPRVKKAKYGYHEEHHHETPAARSVPQPEPPAEPRTLDSDSCTLQQKVERGETITSASRQRYHQIVDQPGNHEDKETSSARP